MLSEEEKKAIEWLKKADWFSARLYSGTILNLIESQQKEIEELKEKGTHITKETVEFVNSHYISKDKIKAKIEKYDDKGMTVNLANRSAGKTFQQALRNEVRKVLQSLLDDEWIKEGGDYVESLEAQRYALNELLEE